MTWDARRDLCGINQCVGCSKASRRWRGVDAKIKHERFHTGRDAAATTPVARCDRRSAQASEPARTRKATNPSSKAATAAQGASGSGANVKAASVGACVELKFYGAFDLHAIDATSARWRGDRADSSPLD